VNCEPLTVNPETVSPYPLNLYVLRTWYLDLERKMSSLQSVEVNRKVRNP
jgi:hypothetical protein